MKQLPATFNCIIISEKLLYSCPLSTSPAFHAKIPKFHHPKLRAAFALPASLHSFGTSFFSIFEQSCFLNWGSVIYSSVSGGFLHM